MKIDSRYLKILLVEDKINTANKLVEILKEIGIDQVSVAQSYTEAIEHFDNHLFDILLVDIMLGRNKRRGDDFVRYIRRKQFATPVIYLTSLFDETTYNEVIGTMPHSFMSKDFSLLELRQAIELCMSSTLNQANITRPIQMVSNQFFIKFGDTYKGVLLSDILYFHTKIGTTYLYTKERHFPTTLLLRTTEEQLYQHGFVRTHKTYVVNIKHIESINLKTDQLMINDLPIPIGYTYRKQVLERLRLLK